MSTKLQNRPAWAALTAHHQKLAPLHLRELFAKDPGRGERLTVEAVGIFLDYSKNRVTDETLALLGKLARGVGAARADRRHVSRRQDQRHREPRGASRRAAGAQGILDRGRRRERGAARARRPRQDERLCQPRPQRRLHRPHRQAAQERGQRRHRRLGPGAGHGLRGAATLRRSRADLPLRLQRRRHRLRRGDLGSRSGRDPLRHLVEDLHHAGDDDQRPDGARLVAGGPRRRRPRGGQALRRGLHQRREGLRVRHRHRQHVRLLGLGRRPLLDGFGHRPLDHAGHRPRGVPVDAGRLPRDGRALPHGALRAEPARFEGAAVALVQRLLRRPDRWPCCRTSNT